MPSENDRHPPGEGPNCSDCPLFYAKGELYKCQPEEPLQAAIYFKDAQLGSKLITLQNARLGFRREIRTLVTQIVDGFPDFTQSIGIDEGKNTFVYDHSYEQDSAKCPLIFELLNYSFDAKTISYVLILMLSEVRSRFSHLAQLLLPSGNSILVPASIDILLENFKEKLAQVSPVIAEIFEIMEYTGSREGVRELMNALNYEVIRRQLNEFDTLGDISPSEFPGIFIDREIFKILTEQTPVKTIRNLLESCYPQLVHTQQ